MHKREHPNIQQKVQLLQRDCAAFTDSWNLSTGS